MSNLAKVPVVMPTPASTSIQANKHVCCDFFGKKEITPKQAKQRYEEGIGNGQVRAYARDETVEEYEGEAGADNPKREHTKPD